MTPLTRSYWRAVMMPNLKGRSAFEVLGIIMTHPVIWAAEATLAGIMISVIMLTSLVNLGHPHLWLFVMTLGPLAAFAFPLFYVFLLWLLDFYQRESLRVIISLFLWGCASTFFALIFNSMEGAFLAQLGGAGVILTATIAAPIVEEFFKGLGLLIIAGHHELEDTYDGLFYGFTVGAGFAAIENFLYFSATPIAVTGMGSWFLLVLYRSTLCALGHGCFTATTGVLIGFLKNRKGSRAYAQLAWIPSVIIAMSLHGLFNLAAYLQSDLGISRQNELMALLPVFHGPLVGVLGFVYFIIITPLAILETRHRVRALRRDAVGQVAERPDLDTELLES